MAYSLTDDFIVTHNSKTLMMVILTVVYWMSLQVDPKSLRQSFIHTPKTAHKMLDTRQKTTSNILGQAEITYANGSTLSLVRFDPDFARFGSSQIWRSLRRLVR